VELCTGFCWDVNLGEGDSLCAVIGTIRSALDFQTEAVTVVNKYKTCWPDLCRLLKKGNGTLFALTIVSSGH